MFRRIVVMLLTTFPFLFYWFIARPEEAKLFAGLPVALFLMALLTPIALYHESTEISMLQYNEEDREAMLLARY